MACVFTSLKTLGKCMKRKCGLFFVQMGIILSCFSYSTAYATDGSVVSESSKFSAMSPEAEIKSIDLKIQALAKKKIEFENKAKHASREADRLQFIDWLTYRMYTVEEESYRAHAKAIEKEIADLKHRKEELLPLVH